MVRETINLAGQHGGSGLVGAVSSLSVDLDADVRCRN